VTFGRGADSVRDFAFPQVREAYGMLTAVTFALLLSWYVWLCLSKFSFRSSQPGLVHSVLRWSRWERGLDTFGKRILCLCRLERFG